MCVNLEMESFSQKAEENGCKVRSHANPLHPILLAYTSWKDALEYVPPGHYLTAAIYDAYIRFSSSCDASITGRCSIILAIGSKCALVRDLSLLIVLNHPLTINFLLA